jgi:3-phenylpropionate/trans-cinnamate dioxygenase ferredoxin reductase subunit
VHEDGFYEAHGIRLHTSTSVESIDTAASEVLLSGGERVPYARLLIATGAEPRRLPVPGGDLDGVHYLRTAADADAIAAQLRPGLRVVVIGAGWIGAEVGASARQKGAEVAIVGQAEVPLERVLGREIGAIYAQLHRDHGVEVIGGAGLTAFEGAGRVERVTLDGGRTLDCDLVVVGVGVTPRTALAEQAGIAVDNGILVSDRLETSIAGVFAAGDVANAYHPFYGRHVRVEHWANALNQPATAARAMLGKPASYDRLPYFFSDQYEAGMEYTGFAAAWDEVVVRGDPEAYEFIAWWLSGGRVVAGMNVGVWDVADKIEAAIRAGEGVPDGLVEDPAAR